MPFTIDHVPVPVAHALFSVRLARVHEDDDVTVLATQLRTVAHSRDVDLLDGVYASTEKRHELVRLGDLNANTARCKLGTVPRPTGLPSVR